MLNYLILLFRSFKPKLLSANAIPRSLIFHILLIILDYLSFSYVIVKAYGF